MGQLGILLDMLQSLEAVRNTMRRPYYDPAPWNLASPETNNKTSIRRWNMVIILILALLVLAVFVAGVGAELKNNAASTTGKNPSASRQQVPIALGESRLRANLVAI
jgi:hypothetical protein